MRPNKDRQNLWLWAALLLPLLWLAEGLAQITEQAHGLSALAAGLTALLNDPLSLRWCSSTPKFLLAVLVLYPLVPIGIIAEADILGKNDFLPRVLAVAVAFVQFPSIAPMGRAVFLAGAAVLLIEQIAIHPQRVEHQNRQQ